MQAIFDYVTEWTSSLANSSWSWFANLTREEWLIVLPVVSLLGFLCMRGYGSRSKY